ncbi:MAG: aminotransferase class V-fold PLP-dependent enzyme [Candidatus Yonathbacteria bacterium]|nr:aminotransferase class V-fold PLP-dependent enzyme [Candidatus Yonathbacteria bacterium]
MISPDIKKDFPAFAHLPEGFAYCDSVASSQTPQCVLDAMDAYYTKSRANVHRGSYNLAERATEDFETARVDIARFIHARPDEIIFTGGATLASNMTYLMLEERLMLAPGDTAVTSILEHHSQLLPLQRLAERNGMILTYAPLGEDSGLDIEATLTLITARTRIVALTLASNVTGAVVDMTRIAARAHEVGAILVVDASAYVGHAPLDVVAIDADMLFFSGHKMCGPTGVGVLYGKHRFLETLRPAFVGGGMAEETTMKDMRCTDSPYRFEAGTPPIAEVIGLGRAAGYLSDLGLEDVRAHIRDITAYALDQFAATPHVILHTMKDPERNIGIVSFTVEGVHAHDIAQVLGERGVAVRAGHHCAQPLAETLGIPASVRAGFHVYNTRADVDALLEGVSAARKIFV